MIQCTKKSEKNKESRKFDHRGFDTVSVYSIVLYLATVRTEVSLRQKRRSKERSDLSLEKPIIMHLTVTYNFAIFP